MSLRWSWLPFVGVAVLGLIALLITGSQRLQPRAFALGSPNQNQVAVLAPVRQACEGPVMSPAAVGSVRIWGNAVGGQTALEVSVHRSHGGGRVTRGDITAGTTPTALTAGLASAVPNRSSVSVCVTNEGPHPFSLHGSPPVRPGVLMKTPGQTAPAEFSLVMLDRSRESLLGSLGTAFSRASLFRPSWVGAWTFWVLTFALVATIAAGAIAIRAAANIDQSAESPQGSDDLMAGGEAPQAAD